MRTTVVVGNPGANSRTRVVAEAVAQAAASALDAPAVVDTQVIELSELAAQLFDWSSDAVAAAVNAVREADLVVVASPTYKATYTGLLKAFLDHFAANSLAGVVAIPVMVGGAAAHTLATEVHLRPLLVELGASQPTQGLFVLEADIDALDEVTAAWLDAGARQVLAKALRPD